MFDPVTRPPILLLSATLEVGASGRVSSSADKSVLSLPFVATVRLLFKGRFRTPAESALLDCAARERRRECFTCRLSRLESPSEFSDVRVG